MPESARRRHLIGTGGPWGTGLLLLGIAVTITGIGYTTAQPSDLSPALDALSQYVPPLAWGALWIAVGVWSMFQALTPPQRHWHVLPIVGILSAWSAASLYYWLFLGLAGGHWTRIWSSGVGWAMLAGLIMCWGRCVNPPRGVRGP